VVQVVWVTEDVILLTWAWGVRVFAGAMELDPALWSGLPFELVERVLAALPVPDACRYRTVSKRWDGLIKSPKFGALSAQSAAKRDASFLAMRCGLGPAETAREAWCFLDLDARRWYTIRDDHPQLPTTPLGYWPAVSAGGLACRYLKPVVRDSFHLLLPRFPRPVVPPMQRPVPPLQRAVPPVQPNVPPRQQVVPPMQPEVPPMQPEVPPRQPEVPPMQPGVPPMQPAVLPVQPEIPPMQPVVPPMQAVVRPRQAVVPPMQPVVRPRLPVMRRRQPVVRPLRFVGGPVQPDVHPMHGLVPPMQGAVRPIQAVIPHFPAWVIPSQPRVFVIMVYNPLVKTLKELPSVPRHLHSKSYAALHLEVDKASLSFKLFLINEHVSATVDESCSNDPLMRIYDSVTNKWKAAATPFCVSGCGVGSVSSIVVFQGFLYAVFGSCRPGCRGFLEGDCVRMEDELWRYNIGEDVWDQVHVDTSTAKYCSIKLFAGKNRLFRIGWSFDYSNARSTSVDDSTLRSRLSDGSQWRLEVSEVQPPGMALNNLFELSKADVVNLFGLVDLNKDEIVASAFANSILLICKFSRKMMVWPKTLLLLTKLSAIFSLAFN
jgi:hypothetical protein